ncbi:MAG: type 4b pilus protein PilO2 [Pseudomonadota bacterium]|nr:type 4b pilus protein PilO2 [Pseudomonadota bacterium]
MEGQRERYGGRVTVGGVAYAAGLFWEPADDPSMVVREARTVARTEGVDADCLVVRASQPPQYGLGWRSVGHTPGLRPLAVAMTEAVGGNFVGVFKLDEGWWFGLSRNDLILPDGDALYADEEMARQHFEREYAEMPEDIPAYAPEHWGIPGTRPTEIEDLITKTPSIKLHSTEGFVSRYRNLFVLGVVFFIALGVVGNYFSKKMEAQEEATRKISEAYDFALKNLNPHQKLPLASDKLVACHALFERMPIVVPGWQPASAKCFGGTPADSDRGVMAVPVQLTSDWLRTDGIFKSLESAAIAADMAWRFKENGESASLSTSSPALLARSERNIWRNIGLRDGREISEMLWDMGHRLEVTFDVRASTKRAGAQILYGPDGVAHTIPATPVPAIFTMTSTIPITSWVNVFDAMPGLVVDSIEWDPGVGIWTIVGRVYQKA